jgi:hypothetical protein
MSRSKSHYYRSRLLRERNRKDERTEPAASKATNGELDDSFALPEYFSPPYPGEHLGDDQGRYPRVVLWDEVA